MKVCLKDAINIAKLKFTNLKLLFKPVITFFGHLGASETRHQHIFDISSPLKLTGHITRKHDVNLYADDTQLYLRRHPSDHFHVSGSFLQLNANKTEIFQEPRFSVFFNNPALQQPWHFIITSSLEKHISSMLQSCFSHFRNILKIFSRLRLSQNSAAT